MRAFEAFKEANDERLGQLERRVSADVVTTDKLDRIDRALDETKRVVDELALKSARPHLGGPARPLRRHARSTRPPSTPTCARARPASLRDLESKALSVGTDTDGGYLVPDELERAVNRARAQRLADPRHRRHPPGVGLGLQASRSPSPAPNRAGSPRPPRGPRPTRPTLAALSEMPSRPWSSTPCRPPPRRCSTTRAVNIDEWIAEEVRDSFAQQEGTAFVTGNGTAKPKGFLDYTKVANASWSWGNIGFIKTGVERRLRHGHRNPGDKLIDLVYSVKSGYRGNGTFVFNRATQAVIRKMKDGDGNYLWQPAAKAGDASMLMGYPVAESEDMPTIATDSYSVAFGDFRRGYLIVDRVGIRVLRDPYSSKPYVLFYTTKRVGGGVQDFDAIKLLKFAA